MRYRAPMLLMSLMALMALMARTAPIEQASVPVLCGRRRLERVIEGAERRRLHGPGARLVQPAVAADSDKGESARCGTAGLQALAADQPCA